MSRHFRRTGCFEDDLLGEPGKTRKSRAEKRGEKQRWKEMNCVTKRLDLPLGKEQMEKMQKEGSTLEQTQKLLEGSKEGKQGDGNEERDGLIYRLKDTLGEQLVLPAACRGDMLSSCPDSSHDT